MVDERRGKDESGFYIRTFTGAQFFWHDIPNNPIRIHDIAHALAMRCRWSGHTKDFYSIAQHCVLCAFYAPEELKLAALLHDANEAYLPDFPSPLKWYLRDEGFAKLKEMEEAVDRRIYREFGLQYPMGPRVKEIDQRMLGTESRDLMPDGQEKLHMPEPYEEEIECWGPRKAEQKYLDTFYYLWETK